MTAVRRLILGQSGAAAAELALCLPMVMALMFGSFEAGNYLLTEHKVIKGVRDGARYAARLPFDYYTACGPNLNAPAAAGLRAVSAVEQDIENVTLSGRPGGGFVRVSGWDAADISVTVSCDGTRNTGLYQTRGTAPRVLVATTVPYPSILGTLGFDTSGAVVRAQAQAAVMGL
ncbi:TadE/TadG family type IV pilus assembly protein [Tsuneonella sp. HG249]